LSFTKLRIPQLPADDIAALAKAIVDHFRSLEGKGVIELDEAKITARQGIIFPATQVAQTDANTLDDYEEGTWVPADGSVAGLVLTITKATYTKVGRLVHFRLHVTYPATASGAASLISGLPFTTDGVHSAAVYTSGAGGATVCQVAGTSINIYAPGSVAITNANLSGAFVVISGSYSV
jgi:hypothetical protein